jgi:hypothetical protein
VPASSDENNGTDFLTDKKASTNEFVISTPYELRFQGFSSELARVLDRIVASKQCFVVRSVAVDKAPAPETEQTQMPAMDPRMMMRYGARYMPQMPAAPPAQKPNRPANVLLDENKLLMVLQVDAVRLKEAPAPAAKPAAKPKQVAQAQPAQ